MQFTVEGFGRVTCTVDEFTELLKNGVLSGKQPYTGVHMQQSSFIPEPGEADTAVGADSIPTAQNGHEISEDVFFKSITPSMAKIAIALSRHEGTIKKSDLLKEAGLSGPGLRRPIGALNDRMRRATQGRIQHFLEVQQPDLENGLPEPVYTVSEPVMGFIRSHEARFH
jgi:hypothetical protein